MHSQNLDYVRISSFSVHSQEFWEKKPQRETSRHCRISSPNVRWPRNRREMEENVFRKNIYFCFECIHTHTQKRHAAWVHIRHTRNELVCFFFGEANELSWNEMWCKNKIKASSHRANTKLEIRNQNEFWGDRKICMRIEKKKKRKYEIKLECFSYPPCGCWSGISIYSRIDFQYTINNKSRIYYELSNVSLWTHNPRNPDFRSYRNRLLRSSCCVSCWWREWNDYQWIAFDLINRLE